MSLQFYQPSIPELDVEELKQRMDSGDPVFLLDVRQPEECEIASLGGHLIPLNELADRMDELQDIDGQIIVYCRSGSRSARAVAYLHSFGMTNVVNLKGGLLAWSERIDPAMPQY